MWVGVLRSMRRLVGRGMLQPPVLASVSCTLPRSGNVKDFGLEDSEGTVLLECPDKGSNHLTRGLVNIPNT